MEYINLTKILEYNTSKIEQKEYLTDGYFKNHILGAMNEACEEILKLALQNAKATEDYDGDPIEIDRWSIIDTINQIKFE